MYGKYIEFEMPEGQTEIQSVKFSDNDVASNKYNVDESQGRVVIGDMGQTVDLAQMKVTIDSVEYIIDYLNK